MIHLYIQERGCGLVVDGLPVLREVAGSNPGGEGDGALVTSLPFNTNTTKKWGIVAQNYRCRVGWAVYSTCVEHALMVKVLESR